MRKNHNTISLISVFKRRVALFCISFLVCGIFGIFFVKNQMQYIEKMSQNSQIYEVNNLFALVKIKKYENFVISPSILGIEIDRFDRDNHCIDEYFLHANEIYFDIYAIAFKPNAESCIYNLISTLNKSPMISSMKSSFKNENAYKVDVINDLYDGPIATLIDITTDINKTNGKPINKHFIYLDKDRSLSQRDYMVTSSIISSHKSLNSGKIWVFMIIVSVIISVFVVFMVEYLRNLKDIFKQIKKS